MGHRKPFERVILSVGSPYGALLLVLIAMLLVYPFLGSHGAISWVLELVTLGLVAAADLAIAYNRMPGLLITDRGDVPTAMRAV